MFAQPRHARRRLFGNHYWPALYFIDAAGRVRDHHFGEGNYEESASKSGKFVSPAAPR